MPKGPGRPWKARKQPVTDHFIQASVERGMNGDGHYGELIVNDLADNAEALEMKRSLFRCGKYLGFSIHAAIEKLPDGTYQVRFKAIDKATARDYVLKKYGGPEGLPYNPYARNPPKDDAA